MSLYELALSVPWLMTAEAVEAMLAIAARDPLPPAETARRMHGTPGALAFQAGTRRDDSARMTMQDGVALIRIDGPIYRYADMFTEVSGGVTTEALARDLQTALDDPAVRAILLVIDSPGGEATGIHELADAIHAGCQRKPVGAYIEGYGASAAYWIASACETIGLDASALVGSIGTVLGVPDPTKRLSPRIEFVSRQSPKKRPDPHSEAGRAVLQQLVDDLTEVFIASVMQYRRLSYEQVTALQGGLAVGQQAVDLGFADQLTSEAAMVADMRRRASARSAIPQGGTRMDWKSFWGGLLGAAEESGAAPLAAQIATEAQTVTGELLSAEPDPRLAQMEAELTRLTEERRATAATAFADQQIRDSRALPAERATLVSLHQQIAATNQPALLTALEAFVSSRPAHTLTKELLPIDPAAAGVLSLDRSGDALAKERQESERVLASTPLGRAVLAKRRA